MILDNLKTAGVQQAHKDGRIAFTALTPWPGELVVAEGRYLEGEGAAAVERRAAIFIGPEFGTVTRPDLVSAAREAGDAGFDVLIACAFNYEAHATEFSKLGRIPVLKARMNADLHLRERKLITHAEMYGRLAARFTGGERPPYDFVVVDEAQDVSVAQLRFVASLGGGRPDALFFAGDLGQRIFQVPFSWRSLGVDIRGRAATLRINYRTSHQIRTQADRLLGKQITDVDGNTEDRRATFSVFNGPAPLVRVVHTAADETAVVGRWLAERTAEGVAPGEMAVFVRSATELPRAQAAVEAAGLGVSLLDEAVRTVRDRVPVGTMHLSKGLEFRAVAVMACDDEVLPLQARIEAVTDEGDLQEVYDTERHLLYVACTRARDNLLVTGVSPASEFLQDLNG